MLCKSWVKPLPKFKYSDVQKANIRAEISNQKAARKVLREMERAAADYLALAAHRLKRSNLGGAGEIGAIEKSVRSTYSYLKNHTNQHTWKGVSRSGLLK